MFQACGQWHVHAVANNRTLGYAMAADRARAVRMAARFARTYTGLPLLLRLMEGTRKW